jgi:hypothetical protein
MTRLRDKVTLVSPSKLPEHLMKAVSEFEKRADELWEVTSLQEGARVFPNILRATARQLGILSASPSLPIEVVAGACRTVFEINIRVRLMTRNPSLIKEFWVERVFEEVSLLEAFKRLADMDTGPLVLRPIDVRLQELRQYILKWQLKKPAFESVFKQSEEAGCSSEYKALYGFYSKYTHGTAWLVNAKDAERDGEGYRGLLTVQTQLYAYDSLGRIDDYVRKQQERAEPGVGADR